MNWNIPEKKKKKRQQGKRQWVGKAEAEAATS